MSTPRYPLLLGVLTSFAVIVRCSYIETECETGSGSPGRCKILSQCPAVIVGIQRDQYPTHCGYVGLYPIVCCPDQDNKKSQGDQHKDKVVPYAAWRIADQKCREYAGFVYATEDVLLVQGSPTKVDTCAVTVDPLVAGGTKTKPREFPHMALVGFELDGSIRWNCGGSLVSPSYILTAAHCLYSGEVPASWVLLGELDQSTEEDDANPQLLAVAERIKHPEHKPPVRYNDIALLRLEEPAQMDGYVRPACLHTEPRVDRKHATVTGWGRIEYGGSPSSSLQKAQLPIADHKTCARVYSSDSKTRMPDGIRAESQICAGGSGVSACQGDSGGPLQHPTNGSHEPYCMYKIVGVSSFGMGCSEVPGVYTRVHHYVPWIAGIVWPPHNASQPATEGEGEEFETRNHDLEVWSRSEGGEPTTEDGVSLEKETTLLEDTRPIGKT